MDDGRAKYQAKTMPQGEKVEAEQKIMVAMITIDSVSAIIVYAIFLRETAKYYLADFLR